jgi:hypothetical protein
MEASRIAQASVFAVAAIGLLILAFISAIADDDAALAVVWVAVAGYAGWRAWSILKKVRSASVDSNSDSKEWLYQ